MAKLVSKTYGDALFELAKQEGRMEEFAPQVEGILEVFQLNGELIKLMEQPKIVKDEKRKVIEDIFTGKVAKEIVGLMVLLIEKSHYTDMVPVFEYFTEQVKEENGIGVARVTSATELRQEQKEQVESRLLETTNYTTFEMNYTVDESLIGGMVIRIGDRVVDSSIKTKLYSLSKELKNIQLAI